MHFDKICISFVGLRRNHERKKRKNVFVNISKVFSATKNQLQKMHKLLRDGSKMSGLHIKSLSGISNVLKPIQLLLTYEPK